MIPVRIIFVSRGVTVYPMQWVGLMMIRCGMAVKSVGMFGVTVRKALTVKMETVKLSSEGRQNLTRSMY